MKYYSISQFSQKTGITADTLRYYEKEGLIQPLRVSNQRRYTDQDCEWADFIKRLKSTGMSIRQIARYTSLRAKGDSTIEARREILYSHKDHIVAERRKLNENLQLLNSKITLYTSQLNKHKTHKSI